MTDHEMITCDEGEARKAAEFHASVFPDSHVGPARGAASDEAMLTMGPIDLATLEAAAAGEATHA